MPRDKNKGLHGDLGHVEPICNWTGKIEPKLSAAICGQLNELSLQIVYRVFLKN
jgi:hypothetical protein